MQVAAATLAALFALAIILAIAALFLHTRRRHPQRYRYWTAPWSIAPGEEPKPQYRRHGGRP